MDFSNGFDTIERHHIFFIILSWPSTLRVNQLLQIESNTETRYGKIHLTKCEHSVSPWCDWGEDEKSRQMLATEDESVKKELQSIIKRNNRKTKREQISEDLTDCVFSMRAERNIQIEDRLEPPSSKIEWIFSIKLKNNKDEYPAYPFV